MKKALLNENNRGWFAHAIGMACDIANSECEVTDGDFDALAKDGGAGGMAVEDFANSLTDEDVAEFLAFYNKVATRN